MAHSPVKVRMGKVADAIAASRTLSPEQREVFAQELVDRLVPSLPKRFDVTLFLSRATGGDSWRSYRGQL